MKLKNKILSFFREFLVHGYTSLEFRAKLFAVLIYANKDYNECEKNILLKVAHDIYKDSNRAEILVQTTYEFIRKIKEEHIQIDNVVVMLNTMLQREKKFYRNIDIDELSMFLNCKASEDALVTREKIIDFFKNELENKKT
jgi:hypothetical protein